MKLVYRGIRHSCRLKGLVVIPDRDALSRSNLTL